MNHLNIGGGWWSTCNILTRWPLPQGSINLGLISTLKSKGKFLSEALILASTNPQYDNRLFIELQVQYMKIPSSNLGRTCYVQKLFLTFRTIFVHNMFSPCSELGIFMYWTCNSMNNLWSYCGLVDAKNKSFWQRFTCKSRKNVSPTCKHPKQGELPWKNSLFRLDMYASTDLAK